MRSLSATLKSAQKGPTRRPHLQVIASDRHTGVNRARFIQWYAGIETDLGHASVCAADDSLTRARFTSGSGISRSRVTSPAAGSDYSQWTSWSLGIAPKANLIALCRAGSTLWAFIVNAANDLQVYAFTSTDNGATWSAIALAFTNDRAVVAIAAAGKANGDVVVSLIPGPVGVGVKAWRWNGATWTGYNGPASAQGFNGIAVTYNSDWNVIATDEAVADLVPAHELRSYIFGDGFSQALNTWSGPTIIHTAISTSSIALTAPYVLSCDVHRLTFRQQYTGAQAYDRIMRSNQPDTAAFVDDLWREPIPFNHATPFGLAIALNATTIFLTSANRVYAVPLAPASLAISADVMSADLPDEHLGTKLGELILNNASGAYTSIGAGDPAARVALTKGCQIAIAPGLYGAAGAENSAGPAYFALRFEHTYERSIAAVRIVLGTPWLHLARHRFPRAVTFAAGAKNCFQQLGFIAARAGYAISTSGASAQMSNLYPPLALPPGLSARDALRRVLDRLPDRAYVVDTLLFFNQPLAADAADATYGRPLAALDQLIAEARYDDGLKDANHAQVIATIDGAIVAEDIDFADLDLLYSAPVQDADPYLSTGAQAVDRATTLQRRQTIDHTTTGRILAPVHCGLELHDIVAITHNQHGLSAAKRRVNGLRLLYNRAGKKARFDHEIALGAP